MSELDVVGAFRAHPVGPLLYAAMVWNVLLGLIRKGTGNADLLKLPGTVINGFWMMVAAVFALHLGRTLLTWA